MSFIFSQPAPGILPANSVDFSEVETIGANTLLGNNTGSDSVILELSVGNVATMLNLSQYTVGAASSIANSIPLFSDNTGKTLVDNSGWVIVGSVLRPLANGNGKVGSNTTRVGEGWFKDVLNLDALAASQILASDASKNIVSLDTATYPSLTELSYVKGVTSGVQSQLNGKASTKLDNLGITAINNNLLFATDNTHSIGVDGASRPSSIYAADHVTAPVIRARDNDGLSQRHLTVRAGNSSSGNGDGGNLTIAAGTQHGTGIPGYMDLQSNGATRIQLTTTGAINIPSFTASAFAGSNSSKDLVSLSSATATSYLNQFTSLLQGVVPASGGGTTNFLRADGTWAAAGVSTVGALDQQVLAYDSGTGLPTWQYAGLGDGSLGTNNIILGRAKPTSFTTANNNIIISTATTNTMTSAQNNIVMGTGGNALTSGGSTILLGDYGSSLTSGTEVVAIGWKSTGTGISGGSVFQSVAIGTRGVCGSNCVSIGDIAQATSSSIAIGQSCGNNGGSNGVTVGNSAGGFGTSRIVCIGNEAVARGGGDGVSVGYRAGGAGVGTDTGGFNTCVGSNAGYGMNNVSAARNVFLGYMAGRRNTTQADELFIDNQDRTTYALQQTNSLLYGKFNATPSSQTLTINAQTTATYGIAVSTAGYGLKVKEGSNAKMGTATLVAGTVTVSTTAVSSTTSRIFLTTQALGTVTVPQAIAVTTITNGASFVITSADVTDTSTIAWMIVDAA